MNNMPQPAPAPMRSLFMGGREQHPFTPAIKAPVPPRMYLDSVYRNLGMHGGEAVSYANDDVWDRNHIREGKRESARGLVRVVNPEVGLQEGSILYTTPDADDKYGALYVVQPRGQRNGHPHILTPARAVKLIPHPDLGGEDVHVKMFIASGLENAGDMAEHILRHSYRGLTLAAAVEVHSRRMQYHFGVQRVRARWCKNSYRDPWRVARDAIGSRVEQEVWKRFGGDRHIVLQPGTNVWEQWDQARDETLDMARGLSTQINKSLVEGLLRQHHELPITPKTFSMER